MTFSSSSPNNTLSSSSNTTTHRRLSILSNHLSLSNTSSESITQLSSSGESQLRLRYCCDPGNGEMVACKCASAGAGGGGNQSSSSSDTNRIVSGCCSSSSSKPLCPTLEASGKAPNCCISTTNPPLLTSTTTTTTTTTTTSTTPKCHCQNRTAPKNTHSNSNSKLAILLNELQDVVVLSREIREALGACMCGCNCLNDCRCASNSTCCSNPTTKKPVVALESTIITHGMPYPSNIDTALLVERQIRDTGAIPATIALMRGKIHVGLSEAQLRELAQQPSENVVKCSRRDIARVCAQGAWGSTTVAATMLICNLVGIRVFVTGGIGGVHRGAETSMDISADLMELGRTPVAVVCAGVKSILDIGKTLEVLETQGVGVTAYGSDEFPAFFVRNSGHKAPSRLDTPQECARMIHMNKRLNLQSGMLIAVPVPEKEAANANQVNSAIKQALQEADERHIAGKDVTPFLLQRINELTGGASLRSNIALIRNNAKVGAEIAVEYAKLVDEKRNTASSSTTAGTRLSPHYTASSSSSSSAAAVNTTPSPVVVIGGSVVDVTGKSNKKIISETSNPGKTFISMGGVARNVNEALARLQCNPLFVGTIGKDSFGSLVLSHFDELKISSRGLRQTSEYRTAIYSCILDNDGELVSAIADMEILEKSLTSEHIRKYESDIAASRLVFMDANLSMDSMRLVANLCSTYRVPLFFEPTSVPKSVRCVKSGILSKITVMKPNRDELLAMASAQEKRTVHSIEEAVGILLDAGVKTILYSAGAQDVIVATCSVEKRRGLHGGGTGSSTSTTPSTLDPLDSTISSGSSDDDSILSDSSSSSDEDENNEPSNQGTLNIHIRRFPVVKLDNMVSATGAGDNFCAGFIFGYVRGFSLEESVTLACESAKSALLSREAVSQDLSPNMILSGLAKRMTESKL